MSSDFESGNTRLSTEETSGNFIPWHQSNSILEYRQTRMQVAGLLVLQPCRDWVGIDAIKKFCVFGKNRRENMVGLLRNSREKP